MPMVEDYLTMMYIEPIGTGLSGHLPNHPQGYSVDRFSEQLHGLLEVLDLTDVLCLGHSHGGFVVQRLALTHPERVSGIILYASSAVTGMELMIAAGENVAAFARRHAGEAVADEVMKAWQAVPGISGDAEYTSAMQSLFPIYFADYNSNKTRFNEMQRSICATMLIGDGLPFDVRDELSGLEKPTLILVGAHDFICGPRWAQILNELIPDAQLVSFADSGHFPHIEQAVDFSKALASFVHSPGRPTALPTSI
jgi:proline iminopeptidase